MARNKGNLPFSGSFEVQSAQPFDARMNVAFKEDLIDLTTWTALDGSDYVYPGMITVVSGDTEENNGLYRLKQKPITEISNWQKIEGSAAIDAYTKTESDEKYQEKLVSGTNIKTINGNSILGSGDIAIGDSGIESVYLDMALIDELDNESTSAEIEEAFANVGGYAEFRNKCLNENLQVFIRDLYPSSYKFDTQLINLASDDRSLQFSYTHSMNYMGSLHGYMVVKRIDNIGEGLFCNSIKIEIKENEGIAEAPVDGNQYSRQDGSWSIINIPTSTSDLTNDSNFVSDANYVHTDYNFTQSAVSQLLECTLFKNNYTPIIDTLVSDTDALSSSKADKENTYTKTEIDNKLASVYTYKGTVETVANLELITTPSVGDVYDVIATGDNYAWNGTDWDKLSGIVDLTNYALKTELPTNTSNLINDSNFVADADYVHTDNNFTTAEKNKLENLVNYDDTEIKANIATKQDILVSSENIKTINGDSLLGSGDILIESGIADAPINGNQYARQDGTWTEIIAKNPDKFILSYSITELTNNSTSEEIINAFGGEDKINEFVEKMKSNTAEFFIEEKQYTDVVGFLPITHRRFINPISRYTIEFTRMGQYIIMEFSNTASVWSLNIIETNMEKIYLDFDSVNSITSATPIVDAVNLFGGADEFLSITSRLRNNPLEILMYSSATKTDAIDVIRYLANNSELELWYIYNDKLTYLKVFNNFNKAVVRTDTLIGGGISEAPIDGKQYARQDETWVETASNIIVVNKTNAEMLNLQLVDNTQINVTDTLLEMTISSVEGVGLINFVAGAAATITLPEGTDWNGNHVPTITEGKLYTMTYAFGTFYIDEGR